VDAIDKAIAAAKTDPRPSLIMVRTTIGFGSPHKAGTCEAHGAPLGADEVKATKVALGWDPEKQFYIPDEAKAHFAAAVDRGAAAEAEWQKHFDAWAAANPALASEWKTALRGELPTDWDAAIPTYEVKDEPATRVSGGKILAAIASKVPWFLGGDADLSCSTMTALPGQGDFSGETGLGRNIRYGVREHAMGAIANGMAYHGQMRSFTATFFVFSDYERPAVRLAALSKLPVIFVFTHDSIGVGEDGPTHQPIEHLAALRAIPNLWVMRPADGNETAQAYRVAMNRTDGPVAMILSRQKAPTIDRTKTAPATGVSRGAYVLRETAGGAPQVVLIATGTEVTLALAAQEKLAASGVRARVVSMPSCELFAAQAADYRDSVLPRDVPRVSVEAASSFGWHRWVGDRGTVIGIDRFGASGPGPTLFKQFGFTADNVARAALELVKS